MRVVKLLEGTFIPSFEGATERFHKGTRHLTRLGVDMMVVHCFRGWTNLDLIAQEDFITIAIPPHFYYKDLSIISQALEVYKPDVIEVSDPERALSSVLELSNKYNTPLAFDAQFVSSSLAAAYTKDKAALKVIADREELLGRCLSGATCFTKLDKKELVQATGMSSRRVQVIPMGSDIEGIHYRKLKPDDNKIVFLGNMYFLPNQEGVEYIANYIAPKLLKKHPSIIFSFVGDAPKILKEKYENQNVQFTGRIGDINNVFEKARVCLTPIITGGGMRTKTLAYMASGVPVVSSSIGAAGIDADKAILIADSPEEFIAKIDTLLQNFEASMEYGHRARQLMEQKYSWSSFAKQYIAFYDKVIQNPLFHNEKPINSTNDPLWLQEVIKKGRFADRQGDPKNIYLLGRGKKTTIPVEAHDIAYKIKQFLK